MWVVEPEVEASVWLFSYRVWNLIFVKLKGSGLLSLQHGCRYDKDAIGGDSWLQSQGVHSLWDSVAAVKLPCCKARAVLLTEESWNKLRGWVLVIIIRLRNRISNVPNIPTFFSSCFPCTSTKSPTTLTSRSSGLKCFTSTWTVNLLSSQCTCQDQNGTGDYIKMKRLRQKIYALART